MKRRGAVVAALSALAALGARAADDALDRIGRQIGQHAVIRAEFTQTKQIAALKKPLVATGSLVFSRRHGVLWRIETPYRMAYVLGEQKVVEIARDGSRRVRDVPGLAQVSRVFQAVLGAQPAALREYFDVTSGTDGARWTVALKPRAQLAQFITGMQVTGDSFVDSIRMDEPGGDSTLLQFRNTAGAAELSDAEVQQFGAPPGQR